MTEPCRYAVAVGIEKEYIPDKNMWATSSTNIARNAQYGRLNGYKGIILNHIIFIVSWK